MNIKESSCTCKTECHMDCQDMNCKCWRHVALQRRYVSPQDVSHKKACEECGWDDGCISYPALDAKVARAITSIPNQM